MFSVSERVKRTDDHLYYYCVLMSFSWRETLVLLRSPQQMDGSPCPSVSFLEDDWTIEKEERQSKALQVHEK